MRTFLYLVTGLEEVTGLPDKFDTATETYLPFGGAKEHPETGEIVFADAAGAAHVRRWTNRQSAASSVSPRTRCALLVIEALHDRAEADVVAGRDALAEELTAQGATSPVGLLHGGEPTSSRHGD